MEKSNIVAIGEGMFPNFHKLIRVFEKNTNIKAESFKNTTVFSISKIKENWTETYGYYKKGVEDDDHLCVFCFKNIDDFNQFDIYEVLKNTAVIIDEISEEDYPMTIDEMNSHCNKMKSHQCGEYTIILVDESNGKEYLLSQCEPRRFLTKETDKTVEFSIYPVKSKVIKEVKKITLSEFIQKELDKMNNSIPWLAKEMNISNSTIYGKIERDSFNAYDLIKISKILSINIDELYELVKIE